MLNHTHKTSEKAILKKESQKTVLGVASSNNTVQPLQLFYRVSSFFPLVESLVLMYRFVLVLKTSIALVCSGNKQ